MSELRAIEVQEDGADRLDRYLAATMAISRTRAARLIADHAVSVNGTVARASYRPARGDRIEVALPEAAPPRTIEPHEIELDVAFEDDHLLIVDKPAGLVVHPAPGHWQDTLVNALVARGTALSEAVPERRGIVHRLDRDTSGLMLVAKTDEAHRRLARAIEARTVQRTYAAVVWGHITTEQVVDAPIGRHPDDRKRMMILATGRAARTRVHPVARFAECDLVRLDLETGRTHQIRVHLLHIGHPVVGDPVYGGGGPRRAAPIRRPEADAVDRACPRQALHAVSLRLAHPETREELEFRSEWPSDLRPMLGLVADDKDLVARPNVLDYLGFFGANG